MDPGSYGMKNPRDAYGACYLFALIWARHVRKSLTFA